MSDRSEHLYDNRSDPYQTRNLAGDPAHRDVLALSSNASG